MPKGRGHHAAVSELLREAPGPLSADEVRDLLSDTGIGIATVYRLLKRGLERGEFAAVEMPHGATRYEPADRPHHHHFECQECHRVFDIPGCPGNLEALVPDGFRLESHDLLLQGQCVQCADPAAGSRRTPRAEVLPA